MAKEAVGVQSDPLRSEQCSPLLSPPPSPPPGGGFGEQAPMPWGWILELSDAVTDLITTTLS